MRILVTGAAGFIGSHLAEQFVRQGYEVIATDLPSADFSAAESAGAQIKPGNLIEKEAVRELVKNIDVIIHAAGLFNYAAAPGLLEKINVQTVHNTAHAAVQAGKCKRFILLSSISVYGKPRKVPCHEEDPKKPRNAYEKTKWKGEQAAWSYYERDGLPVTVIRPGLVYGPRSKYGNVLYLCFIASLAARGKKQMKFIWEGGPKVHHGIHAEDLAEASRILLHSDEAVGKSFNVCDEDYLSFSDIFKVMMEPYGITPRRIIPYKTWLNMCMVYPLRYAPQSLHAYLNNKIQKLWQHTVQTFNLKPALNPSFHRGWLDYSLHDFYYDTTRIKSLGFKHRYPHFREGMLKTMEWYRENKWLP